MVGGKEIDRADAIADHDPGAYASYSVCGLGQLSESKDPSLQGKEHSNISGTEPL